MSKTFNEAQREQCLKVWDEARKRDLDERLGISERPTDDSGRLAAALLRIDQLEREKAELERQNAELVKAAKDALNTVLWLERRLPLGYDKVPHVQRTIASLEAATQPEGDK